MENDNGKTEATAARKALRTLREDTSRIAPRVRAPFWYRFAFALAVVAFIRAFGLEGSAFILVISISAAAAVGLGLVRPWVTKTQADPWADGPALRWGLLQTGAVLAFGAAGIFLFTVTNEEWVLWLGSVLAGAACLWSSARMENALANSIRENR
ncbi:hypothetical protein [Pseudarthrobacter sp. PS3-L1]|uniref:hypothetical protein n=1 Tax=Pseudarthrobacter sp. PS3-L1 TaxID=3046207 RepID=UPI0024BB8BE5|nr:hypothetical protein [Pseudarthrobacter sp. PS3-L1]MDJ0322008.1 hypothetical protein [Pseudarthrobacter sp. PS3-L1]